MADVALPEVDVSLRAALEDKSRSDRDFWSFRRHFRGADPMAYYQYPAMMIPGMQRAILDLLVQLQPGIRSVFDPFIGSGTVVTEAMLAGLSVSCSDVNPLAVLVTRSKMGPFLADELREAVLGATARALGDRRRRCEAHFPYLTKWFDPAAVVALSRLRRSIRQENRSWARSFLWVCLAETVRRSSRSRTSTYKLHIRPQHELASLPSPLPLFREIAEHSLEGYHVRGQELEHRGHLDRGTYRWPVECALRDARVPAHGPFDLLMTSPPYGDNLSTVPYGQNSYLPLQWIDLDDIDPEAEPALLGSTYEIDNRSLGGRLPRGDMWAASESLRTRSPSLHKTMLGLTDLPVDRLSRVFGFVRDLDACLEPMLAALRPNAYLVFTLGNRRVGGRPVPLDAILAELLAPLGVRLVCRFERNIPTKRMASRNAIASTMRTESCHIFRYEPGGST
jgi:hypothetical protein